MNLKYYITPLLRYWWLLVAALVVATVCSFLVTRRQPPIYQTRTTMVIGQGVYEANPNANDIWISQQLSSYYADIANRQEVRQSTMEALGLNRLPEVSVQALANTQFLEIVVTDNNPRRAQAVANEFANQLIKRSPVSSEMEDQDRQKFINDQVVYLEGKIKETLNEIDQAELKLMDQTSARQIAETQGEITTLQTKLSQLQQNYASLVANTQQGAINSLSVIEPAGLPTTPIGPRKALTIGLSALVALIIAVAAAYLLEYLDDTFKSSEEVLHHLNLPVIGQISEIPYLKAEGVAGAGKKNLALIKNTQSLLLNRRRSPDMPDEQADGIYVAENPRSLIAESFRSLRINLEFEGINQSLRTVLITSPEPSEGKTSIASNLAVVMAQGGKRVILIDADLRRPMVHHFFKLTNLNGLTEVLSEQMYLHEAIRPWEEKNISLITSGSEPPNPVDLLSSEKFTQMIEQLKQWTDIIIVDGPPMILPDSMALSTRVDGVLVVLRHGYTRRDFARNGVDQIRRVGGHIIGVVLNRVPPSVARYYSHAAYYGYYEGDRKTSSAVVRQ
jgi:polysaccharide biosynthesis transport protein